MKTLRTLIITIPAVRNISRNGEVIILDDHSVYLIDTMDHLKTRNWERHHSIRVIPNGSKCVLLNYNTGDEVSADSARPCSPAIGRDVTPRAIPSRRACQRRVGCPIRSVPPANVAPRREARAVQWESFTTHFTSFRASINGL
jgi:hypothetical protein